HLGRRHLPHYVEKRDLIGREVTVVSQEGWGPFQVWDLNQQTLLLEGDEPSTHAWAYEHEGRPLIIEAKSGALTARHIVVRTDREPAAWTVGSSIGPIEIEGATFSSLVRLHGQTTLLSSTIGSVRIWNLHDMLQEALRASAPAADESAPTGPGVRVLAWGKE